MFEINMTFWIPKRFSLHLFLTLAADVIYAQL